MSRQERVPLIVKNGSRPEKNGYIHIGKAPNQRDENVKLTFLQKLSYGLGHVYNDLCASMWFSYTLLFFQAVLEMKSTLSGSMMLLGQVTDAIATPIVGTLADRWSTKRIWHIIGSVLVCLSFPLIFSQCIGCSIGSESLLEWWQPLYYAIVIVIFQCGWAVVQISHLAMIPLLTENLKERSELTTIRYIANVCSGVTVYVITWIVLHSDSKEMTITSNDDYKFRDISLSVTGLGVFLSIIFHIGIYRQLKTPLNNAIKTENKFTDNIIEDDKPIRLDKNFFASFFLYQVTLLYVASRLFSILSLIYVPLYLDERLGAADSTETVESIASVPLAVYISSFFASILLKHFNKCISHKILYIIGSMIGIGACIWIATSLTSSSGPYQLYSVAALLGIGNSMTIITSLCITADMIGTHSNQGGLVYSVVTFADKLISGIVVIIIERFKCTNEADCPDYYRNILAYVCGGSALLGLTTMLICEAKNFINYIRNCRNTK